MCPGKMWAEENPDSGGTKSQTLKGCGDMTSFAFPFCGANFSVLWKSPPDMLATRSQMPESHGYTYIKGQGNKVSG